MVEAYKLNFIHAKYAKICNNMQNMQLGQAGFEPRTFGIKDNTSPTLPTLPDSLTPKYVYVIFLCTLLRIFAYHCIFCAYSLHIYFICVHIHAYSVHICAYSSWLHIYCIFSAYFLCIFSAYFFICIMTLHISCIFYEYFEPPKD